ncbi:hypothetical protein BRARA_B02806 [Brassica rapa]|nr:hypothetical protein BRARA_B02806 [Brassica rapa]
MVTGESVPVSKEVDSPGSVNMVFFHIKATKVGSDAVLSQIISLVETAQMSKAPIQKFADYVASIFVPVVIALALFTLVGWSIGWLPEKGTHFVFSLMFSISVVVIACPCALGLATNGVLIKGGDALEKAHKVKYVIFDKTGTLLDSRETYRGNRKSLLRDGPWREFLTLVASAEANSENRWQKL